MKPIILMLIVFGSELLTCQVRAVPVLPSPCKFTGCIHKCCGQNEIMLGRNCSFISNSRLDFDVFKERTSDNLGLIYNSGCRQGTTQVLLDPVVEPFHIRKDGTLVFRESEEELGVEKYCLEKFVKNGNIEGVTAMWCVDADDIMEEVPLGYSIGMIISMPFLLATFIAYALLPDRNLHMKALMSYVINLMFGYLLLVIIQLSRSSFSPGSCTALGYFCIFFFLVSFFWMNVICIDIWFAFSRFRGLSGSKSAERKRFLLYCAYAWGMSILHVVVILIIDKVSGRMAWYAPGIGDGQCFIKSGVAELLYFYGPMGLLITINVVLFAATAIKIRNVKKDTAMLKKDDSKRHSYENDKQKFNLYLKLLFAMGVNWSLEIVSWAVNLNLGQVPAYIWYLTDFCNAIYGVFIFFMFVFKKSIWKLLKKRYYSFIGKPHLAHSMTQNPTRTTSYSTAHTSINDRGTTETSTLSTEA